MECNRGLISKKVVAINDYIFDCDLIFVVITTVNFFFRNIHIVFYIENS